MIHWDPHTPLLDQTRTARLDCFLCNLIGESDSRSQVGARTRKSFNRYQTPLPIFEVERLGTRLVCDGNN